MTWDQYFAILQNISLRYFLFAGIAFLIGYLLFRRWLSYKKIQQRFPKSKDYIREIAYSVVTMLFFAFFPLLLIKNPAIEPYTTHYTKIEEYGWVYFLGAFPLMFMIHDTYFYWTHRFMHHPKVFRIFHLVHHQSTNPSPWAAYAFHPLEAIIEAGIIPVFLFTIPIHNVHLPIFFLLSIIYNVYGHTGYELYPKGFSKNWFGKWINTSVNHNLHHQYFKGNYGLYFLFWDRMLGTIRKDYDERFEEVKGRKKLEPVLMEN
jgi:sterol desaturase/sphingolipid hydroxylase (fatty acid hydroxylase superfamily)